MDLPLKGVGNAFGYSILQRAVRAGLEERGAVLREGAPIRLSITSPAAFEPKPSRFNAIFTMWENWFMEPGDVAKLSRADLILVPSQFCLDLFRSHGLQNVKRVPLGIYREDWPFQRREWTPPAQPFRWLWVGAPNARKGWDVLLAAWEPFRKLKDAELVLKTTGTDREEEVVRDGNVIVDNRVLSHPEMVAMYHSAHGFVFPTAGEGWGLTLQEAMATGLPAIATRYSGHLDFCTEQNSYLVGYGRTRRDGAPGGETVCADADEVAERMLAVMRCYPVALERARRGAASASRFTWDRSADTLTLHLNRAAARAGLAVAEE